MIWSRYGFAWVTGALFVITLTGHWVFGWFACRDCCCFLPRYRSHKRYRRGFHMEEAAVRGAAIAQPVAYDIRTVRLQLRRHDTRGRDADVSARQVNCKQLHATCRKPNGERRQIVGLAWHGRERRHAIWPEQRAL